MFLRYDILTLLLETAQFKPKHRRCLSIAIIIHRSILTLLLFFMRCSQGICRVECASQSKAGQLRDIPRPVLLWRAAGTLRLGLRLFRWSAAGGRGVRAQGSRVRLAQGPSERHQETGARTPPRTRSYMHLVRSELRPV